MDENSFDKTNCNITVINKPKLFCEEHFLNEGYLATLKNNASLQVPFIMGFPCGSAGKESACNAGGLGSIPGLGRFPGEGKGYPLQYSGLKNSMDYIGLYGVAKSWT